MRASPGPACRRCRWFEGGSRALEAALPGWASLSSADASVRDGDGLCRLEDRLVRAGASCGRFAP